MCWADKERWEWCSGTASVLGRVGQCSGTLAGPPRVIIKQLNNTSTMRAREGGEGHCSPHLIQHSDGQTDVMLLWIGKVLLKNYIRNHGSVKILIGRTIAVSTATGWMHCFLLDNQGLLCDNSAWSLVLYCNYYLCYIKIVWKYQQMCYCSNGFSKDH